MPEVNFSVKTYQTLGSRVNETIGEGAVKILQLLQIQKEGFYHEEILSRVKGSDMIVRPVLYSLYCSGFIDRNTRGRMKFYSINKNGERLLRDIKGGLFDV